MLLNEALSACFVAQKDGRFLYQIPADFPAFKGHFPGNPLLPAVCQMGLHADAFSRQSGKKQEIAGVSRAKFMRPILPNCQVNLSFLPRPDGQYLAELTDETGKKLSQLICSFKEVL